jgi:signal transduction histidine kinase
MKRSERIKLLFQELNENPYRKLNLAFILISVIPILTLIYLFFGNVLSGYYDIAEISPVFILAGVIILLGYAIGYMVMQNIVNKILAYAAKAKRADELKSMFAVSLAHDLKSPIHALKMNLAYLEEGSNGELSAKKKEAADICNNLADRMNRMVMELIDNYMFESRVAKISFGHFDLRQLVEEQRRELEAIAHAKNITIKAEISNKPLMIVADREKILRVINNLLNNSIKYTQRGGIITIKSYQADGFARTEFMNNGTPIPEEMLERIFDKFERIDTSEEGHGLGLAIAKDIVELHKGKVWAASAPGKQNCFTMLLPLARERLGIEGTKPKILIIEDDKELASRLASFLAGYGYDIICDNNALSGIKDSRTKDINLVILDLGLPGVDDFFVLKNLRKLPETINIPIIVSTANVGEGIEWKVREMGADDFIRKPFEIKSLLEKVRVFLPL